MTVRALLVDADGVLQRNPDGWLDEVARHVPDDEGEAFTRDLFATEQDAMEGRRGFDEVLDEVCTRWGLADRDRLRSLWRTTLVSHEVLAVVGEVRAAGTPVHLATNQNDVRAAYLRDEVGYAERFDSLLVSCELGCTKDDPAYFRKAAAALGHAPASLLLVDDSEDNVATARDAGLLAEQWAIEDGVDRLRTLLAGHGLLAR